MRETFWDGTKVLKKWSSEIKVEILENKSQISEEKKWNSVKIEINVFKNSEKSQDSEKKLDFKNCGKSGNSVKKQKF